MFQCFLDPECQLGSLADILNNLIPRPLISPKSISPAFPHISVSAFHPFGCEGQKFWSHHWFLFFVSHHIRFTDKWSRVCLQTFSVHDHCPPSPASLLTWTTAVDFTSFPLTPDCNMMKLYIWGVSLAFMSFRNTVTVRYFGKSRYLPPGRPLFEC